MKNKIFFFLIILICFSFVTLSYSQARRLRELRQSYVAPEEIVSFSKTTVFSQALVIINDLSKKFLGKIIIDPISRSIPIGIDIDKMHWLTAFELILKEHNLWYDEFQEYLKITSLVKDQTTMSEEERNAVVKFNTREVVISAIFFEADDSKLRQAGMSWDIFRGKDLNARGKMSAADNRGGLLEIQVDPNLEFGDVLAMFKTLESNQIGEVISSPQITVRSGEEGQIQVGSDIAITLRDFAGNSVTQFFSTGSIIKVNPEVIQHDSIDFIHLDLEIERSNTASGDIGLEIKKSKAQTSILLLDGEETVIGGLYVDEESHFREGIPLLKDLPWWFFGLRYVFGYESKSYIKKELLILLKAELLPTLAERAQRRLNKIKNEKILLENRRKFKQRLNSLKSQSKAKY
jgi:type IV pilus assembly protein PilQ